MRKAVAMIELIVSIVIIGVAVLSAPNLINQARTGINVAVKQEAIASAASNIEMIMTREWDESGTDSKYHPTILITSGAEGLNPLENEVRRIGTPITSQRTFVNAAGESYTASTELKEDSVGDVDDVDDSNGREVNLVVSGEVDDIGSDYADTDIKMTTTVTYLNDEPSEGTFDSNTLTLNDPFTSIAGGTSNIKSIWIQLTTDSEDVQHFKNISLRAFSTNIGSFQLNQRSFK